MTARVDTLPPQQADRPIESLTHLDDLDLSGPGSEHTPPTTSDQNEPKPGLKINRRYTTAGKDPYQGISWVKRDSRITNPDGSVVFEMKNVEVPEHWSQVAVDIIVSKYFRKAGVPSTPNGSEYSAKQVFDRLATTWRWWGEQHEYFDTPEDAQAFEDEIKYMLAHQVGAPNSPQWFNTGLHHSYGLTGPKQGFWYVDPDTEQTVESPDAYSRPSPHACFILSVDDDLVNPGGIMDLWVREARIFKFGSGAGSNFSKIRGEEESLSGGGKSSGVMSFLKIGDRAAGAIKSGGTTRRAAKMVILDIDHPDIESFVNWKREEENKVRLLVEHGDYDPDFNGEAYATVSGQNSNNSVRVTNEFIEALANDADWELVNRTDQQVRKTVKASDLWHQIAQAAWECADPGLQFDTTINEWHTCPEGGAIRASNPCSEYMFLDDTACNLASLNLTQFYDQQTGSFDIETYQHAIRLFTIVLEISVAMAHFPSEKIAQGSYDYRTLGLGYANLGSLLMRQGHPYDSDRARAIAAALTSILTGTAYAASAEMAQVVGAFPKYQENRSAMMRVIKNHRRAAYNKPQEEYKGVSHEVIGIDPEFCPPDLLQAAQRSWDRAKKLGKKHGFRNAQTTVLAPTGTIGLLMDCDTTGVEPDFALVKFKKLAGSGFFKIANQSIAPALDRLGYDQSQIEDIVHYIVGTSSLTASPHINRDKLLATGLKGAEIDRIEAGLSAAFDISHAFHAHAIGVEACKRLGFPDPNQPDADLLSFLGFTPEQISQANYHICGRQTIEGAPHLLPKHLPVFDTANRNGQLGQRFIHHIGHIKMMAAVQPFISGAISKTINMPNDVTPQDIEQAYQLSWKLGLKAMALYRDGSKASQPLSATAEEGGSLDLEEDDVIREALEQEQRLNRWEIPTGMSPTQAYDQGMRPPRFLLPSRRSGYNQEARVGGYKIYLRTGEYDDGTLGEIFIDLAKEGATLKGILSCFAIAVSKGLQYGVPLEEFVDTFTFQTFEPRGVVEGHPNIKMTNSIIDFVFRALGVEYLHRDDLAQTPPDRSGDLSDAPKGLAAEAGRQMELGDAVVEHELEFKNSAKTPTATRPLETDSLTEEAKIQPRTATAVLTDPTPTPEQVTSNGSGTPRVMANFKPDSVEPMELAVEKGSTREANAAFDQLMGDAPPCDQCGFITIRNGSCYRCANCGNSMGCS